MAAHAGADTLVVTERSVLTDRYVFAPMLRAQGKLSELEWTLFERAYDLLLDKMPVRGIVYVTTGVDTSLSRIAKRNRPGEAIGREYLADLDAAHTAWVGTTPLPVLRVSLEDGQDVAAVADSVAKFVDALRASAPATPAAAGGAPSTKKRASSPPAKVLAPAARAVAGPAAGSPLASL